MPKERPIIFFISLACHDYIHVWLKHVEPNMFRRVHVCQITS